jgi:hypothetical protein
MARRLTQPGRRAASLLLVVGVLVLHLAATRWLASNMVDWRGTAPMPERLSAVFVREVKPAAPPAAVPPPAPPARKPARRTRPRPAAAAASQPKAPAAASSAPAPSEPPPAEAAVATKPPSESVVGGPSGSASAPAAAPELPGSAPAVAQAASAASAPASAASAPDWPTAWPASTRLTYSLTGWYRGELHGAATVEWLRDGAHYQVHVDVRVGPPFAPFMVRRMSSDGELTGDGLAPRRYDEETRVGFGAPRQVTIRFEPDVVVLPNGRQRERWPGVQDAASQFVHLTWLFTTRPQRLEPGHSVDVPLALPRSMDHWRYDILAAEDLRVPFGTLPVRHLKPRRVAQPGGDLVVEAWFAPTLLYLPVRIKIHQDAETYIDLLIDRPPVQAAPGN